jgi:hypothetical protein
VSAATGAFLWSASIEVPSIKVKLPFMVVPSAIAHSTPPSYIALFGHSGSHAPQFIHSSVILIAMFVNLLQFNKNLMNVQERINLMVKAGEYLMDNTEEWQEIKQQAFYKNGWFTTDFTQHAAKTIAQNFLTKEALEKWVAHYHIDDNITPKNIGIVMAGNIPMVGFHDMLCVFISGH